MTSLVDTSKSAESIWNDTWTDIIPEGVSYNGHPIGVAAGEAVGQALDGVFNQAMSIFTDSATKNGDKNVIAIGGGADSVNTARNEIFNEQQKARSKSAPSYCDGVKQGATHLTVEKKSVQTFKKISNGRIKSHLIANSAKRDGSGSFIDYKELYGDFSKPQGLTYILNFNEVLTGDKLEDSSNSIKLLVGKAVTNETGPLLKYATDNDVETSTKATYSLRAITTASAGAFPFVVSQSRNIPTVDDTVTFHRSLESEITRTYGDDGTGWRNALDNSDSPYSSPVPLQIELNSLMAFNNYLLNLKYHELETQLLLSTIKAIELIRKETILKFSKNNKSRD